MAYALDFAHGQPIMFHEEKNFLFPGEKFLLSSDLHSKAMSIFRTLDVEGLLKDANVILAGDMSGEALAKKGSDGDALPLYRFILSRAKRLYFVQGNHDIFSPEQEELKNKDGTFCCLHDKVVLTPFGKIGGINGIVGKPNRGKHVYSKKEYNSYLQKLRQAKVDILVTHEPITDKIARVHLYGHHHEPLVLDSGFVNQHRINLDARVIVLS